VGQILNHPTFQRLQSWTGDGALLGALKDSTQNTALSLVGATTQRLPTLLSGTAHFALDLLIYYLTVASLLYEGPPFLAWALRISPLKPDHTRRLFEVFAEFARNVVLAGLFTGMLQGVVAGIGYWILGVDRPLLFALLTGTLAYVPLVGTALVWLPLSLVAAIQGSWGQAAGILAWSIFLTTSVDNFLKPLLVRGRSNVPPALIFLGVFGGLSWLGLIGILVGPVAVALLLALFKLYEESLGEKGG
jgi:predicted PurR-regulated permease PerM